MMGQLEFAFPSELIVDNFAGGGGASLGIEQAFGRPVDIAINHNAVALDVHRANHPTTEHLCSDVWDVDPTEVVGNRNVGLAWFSPDCKHFSKAKGSKPVEKKIRGLAWVAVRWAAKVKPRVICLENVEEFQNWGPLKKVNGKWYPDPDRKGVTFQKFVDSLRRLGYKVEYRQLRACDFGAPTIRKRLFLIARRDDQPIVWPKPTHGPKLQPYRTAAECIDWSRPCPSIFLSKDEGRELNVKRPLAEATMRRIARGIMKYVVNSAKPFIVPIQHYGTYDTVHDIDNPLRTVTAHPKGGAFTLVSPTLVQTGYGERPGQKPRALDIQAPVGTIVGGGNKHAMVSAFLAQHNTGVIGRPSEKPISTLTSRGTQQQVVAATLSHAYTSNTCGGNGDLKSPAKTVTTARHHSLVTAHLERQFSQSAGANADEPLGTITAGGGGKSAIVNAFLIKYYGEGGQWADPADPMHTVPTRDRLGLVTVEGVDYVISDIGMRMLTPRELYRAQGFPDEYIVDRGASGKAVTKTNQIMLCGNSVCPPLAKAIVEANVGKMTQWEKRVAAGGA